MDNSRYTSPLFRTLSLRLCHVMDQIGASEEIRKVWKETYVRKEIMASYGDSTKESYVFGSSIEGTKTLGMISDEDTLISLSSLPIVQKTADAPVGKSLLLVQDDADYKAGYGKLQLLDNGNVVRGDTIATSPQLGPFPMVKDDNNVFLSNVLYAADAVTSEPERHGPALLGDAAGVESEDIVLATRCKGWPNEAREWLDRHKQCSWPPAHLIDQMQSYGFFMVPISHPHSSKRSLGWRISLSLQERLLMWNLNPVQFKCYVLLKLIKKDIINSLVLNESISSYHCKTCIFYMAERTSPHFWRPENFLSCMVSCLEMMFSWAREGVCPNYFISGENMFERRVHGQVQIDLCNALQKLLSSDCKFLLMIKTDGLGEKLENFHVRQGMNVLDTKLRLYISSGLFLKERVHVNFLSESTTAIDKLIQSLGNLITELNDIETITEHTAEETKEALSYFLPYFELELLSVLAAKEAKKGPITANVTDILLSEKWHELSLKSDCLSAKLKQATFLISVRQEKMSLDILHSVEKCCSLYYVTACKCRILPFSGVNFSSDLLQAIHQEGADISAKQFLNEYFIPCVAFLPIERDIIPAALVYEMNRSKDMKPGTRYDFLDNWYDWAVVDGKVLIWFLFYLNHNGLGMKSHAADNLRNLEWLLNNDRNLKHKETGFNLLGWAYKQQRCREKAIQCFLKSLQIVKTHNAALWHLMTSLNETVNWKQH